MKQHNYNTNIYTQILVQHSIYTDIHYNYTSILVLVQYSDKTFKVGVIIHFGTHY